MLNVDTGEIRLHRSNFVLHAGVTPQNIEEQLSDQIIHRRETDNHYAHYWLCADIASPEYITANLIFFKNRLLSIYLYPQDHSETISKTLAPPLSFSLHRISSAHGIKNTFPKQKCRSNGEPLVSARDQTQSIIRPPL